MESISILGLGRVGGALAIALRRASINVDPLIYRVSEPEGLAYDGARLIAFAELSGIDSDVLVIATADPEIRPTSRLISELRELPAVVLHLSGSLSSDELEDLKTKGVAVGSMHPLVSISEAPLGSERFAGAYFCVEGDRAAVDVAKQIIDVLDGRSFSIETRFKPLYHASAVMASGNVTALFDAAIEMLSTCGLRNDRAHEILLPLLQSTVANLNERSTREALTGPFVRGDTAAFERHLTAFDGVVGSDVTQIYLSLAERSVRLAGVANEKDLLEAISVAKRKTEC